MLHQLMQRSSAQSLLGANVAEQVTDTVTVAPAEQQKVHDEPWLLQQAIRQKLPSKGITHLSKHDNAELTTHCRTCKAPERRQDLTGWHDKAS